MFNNADNSRIKLYEHGYGDEDAEDRNINFSNLIYILKCTRHVRR